MVIKVADFGLAVHTGDKDYYRLSANMGVKLPVMWMAPESLTNCVFSEMSDVVSSIFQNLYLCILLMSCKHTCDQLHICYFSGAME